MLLDSLKLFWSWATFDVKSKIFALLGLSILGAVTEIMSLSAIVPFVAVLADPLRFSQNEIVKYFMLSLSIRQTQLPLLISLIFCVAVIFAGIYRWLLLACTIRISASISHKFSCDYLNHILGQNYVFFLEKNSSEILIGAQRSFAISSSYLTPLLTIVVSTILSIAIVSSLVYLNPTVALGSAFVFLVSYVLIAAFVKKSLNRIGEISALSGPKMTQIIQEAIGNIRDVIIDGSRSFYTQRYSSQAQIAAESNAKLNYINQTPRYAIEMIAMVVVALVALVNSGDADSFSSVLPLLAALALGAQRLMPLAQGIYSNWGGLMGGIPAIRDVLLVVAKHEPEISPPSVGINISFKKFELKDVSFSYETDGKVSTLKNVSLAITSGDVIGIVGKTGSGKSTFVDLVMGLLVPASGTIYMDSVPLDINNLSAWRGLISHVPQTIFLTDGTIADNIALATLIHDRDDDALLSACRCAQLTEFIESLPEGLNTVVGERGVRLSGGQRQRIGIARALYKRKPFLVLDEATSALDDDTESKVMQSLHDNYPNLTVLMVAHRKSSLKHCDYIIELESGRISREFAPSSL